MVFNFQQYFSYNVAVILLMEETGVPGENHRPAAGHGQEELKDTADYIVVP
jgi:hypothetical protein